MVGCKAPEFACLVAHTVGTHFLIAPQRLPAGKRWLRSQSTEE